MKMNKTERRLSSFISNEFGEAEGAQDDTLQSFRQEALEYYQGAPRGDEVEGRSDVVSLDLASSVNTTLALMKSMLVDECAVTFEAFGPDDEPQAKAESDVCHDVFYGHLNGEMHLQHAIKDGLLSRQSWIAFDVEERDGHNMITVRSPASENMAYQAAFEGELQDIRFLAELIPYSRSDLVEMGFPKDRVDKLPDRSSEQWNSASQQRNVRVNTYSGPPGERDGDIVEVWLCYILIDLDGDGVNERHRVWYNNNVILGHEPFDIVPYAMGTPFISPHRISGEGLHDRLKQVQDTNTSLQRQLIDNVATINNGRYIYDPSKVNEADVLKPKAGGGIRSRDPNAIIPLVVQDVTGGIMAALEFFRRKRGEIGGASTDMGEVSAQLMQKSATQASIDKANSELMTNLIASTLGQTLIKQTFKLMRYFLRTYSTNTYPANINGEVVPVDPLQWGDYRVCKVLAGKSPGEKSQEAMALGQHLQLQVMAMQSGMDGQLADANTLYKTQLQFLKLNGVKDAEMYLIDPKSPNAQQAAHPLTWARYRPSLCRNQQPRPALIRPTLS